MPIDYESFIHPHDRKALTAMKSIPLFDTAVRQMLKIYNERMLHVLNMASNVRVSPKMYPEIYGCVVDICSKLGIDRPEVYLQQSPFPNAWTYGDTKPYIIITSALVEAADKREIYCVLAHECGHILCHHVLYSTMAHVALEFGSSFVGKFLSETLLCALFYWTRQSEFSADRVAAYCLDETDTFVRMAIRLSGGLKGEFTPTMMQSFIDQAKDYEDEIDESFYNKMFHFMYTVKSSHPFMSLRALEVTRWFKSCRNSLPLPADNERRRLTF